MKNLKSDTLAAIGIVSLAASLTLNIVRANGAQGTTVTSSTNHFYSGRVYLLSPANGTGMIKCKVSSVDGTWIYCEGENEWVNTNAMMTVVDSR